MKPGSPMLEPLRRFFDQMHHQNVPYCHWKSNEHLREGLTGLTDLDLLVDRARSRELSAILAATGFRRFTAAPGAAYPAVEDYLGFDHETGALLHLHVHYRLVLGEKHLKGYCLPWADVVLDRRVTDSESGVFTADPAAELVLLLVRSALKLRGRDRIRELRGRPALGKNERRELSWLLERTSSAEVVAVSEMLVGPAAATLLSEMVERGPSLAALRRLRHAIEGPLLLHRTYGRTEARLLRVVRELSWLVAGVNARTVRRPLGLRRFDPTGGSVIAFLGADGSGKSTMVREVMRWLAWKLDVHSVYHGSGDGTASWLRRPLVVARGLARRRPRRDSRSAAGGPAKAESMADESPEARPMAVESQETVPATGADHHTVSRPRRVTAYLALWALVLSWEKRTKLVRSWRARHRGMVVVTDRYPQHQVDGFNDGPLLAAWRHHPSQLLRAVAAWEAAPYRWASTTPPDVVIKLHVDPDVAHARKSGDAMTRTEVARRVRAVEELSFPVERVHVIDANRSLEEVLLDVKRVVWSRM